VWVSAIYYFSVSPSKQCGNMAFSLNIHSCAPYCWHQSARLKTKNALAAYSSSSSSISSSSSAASYSSTAAAGPLLSDTAAHAELICASFAGVGEPSKCIQGLFENFPLVGYHDPTMEKARVGGVRWAVFQRTSRRKKKE
jgi:hypothetical protein